MGERRNEGCSSELEVWGGARDAIETHHRGRPSLSLQRVGGNGQRGVVPMGFSRRRVDERQHAQSTISRSAVVTIDVPMSYSVGAACFALSTRFQGVAVTHWQIKTNRVDERQHAHARRNRGCRCVADGRRASNPFPGNALCQGFDGEKAARAVIGPRSTVGEGHAGAAGCVNACATGSETYGE